MTARIAVPSVDSSVGMKLLPTVLSTIAGSTDAICFLGLGGLFTAHITGNLVVLAAHVVSGGAEQMDVFRKIAPLHTAQPPYNLFEREAEQAVLPYCLRHGVATLTYGALCRGLLSGRMRADTRFAGDDLRRTDPKFRPPRYAQYLRAVDAIGHLAQERFGKSVLALAIRWVLDQPGVHVALWGARSPEQVNPVDEAIGWSLDAAAKQAVDVILRETVTDPVGPEFMAPPAGGVGVPGAPRATA